MADKEINDHEVHMMMVNIVDVVDMIVSIHRTFLLSAQASGNTQVKLKRLRSLDAFGKTLICTIALFYDEVSQVYACFRPWGSMHQASVHSKLVQSFNYISIHFKRF